VNRALALLKTLFNKAVEWGRLETSPAARVKKLRESNGRDRYLDRDEACRLFAAADPVVLVPVLVVALGTGMRKGEILSMKWKDLDLVRGIITITDQKNGKTDKIPASGEVVAALGAIPRRGEFVFWNEETKTHLRDVKKIFGEAVARAEIQDFRFHDLRHTAFSWMDQEGVKITTIQKIARHASIEMTRRYIHDRPEDQREAVGKIGGILDAARRNPVTPPGTVKIPAPAETPANSRTREN
jgi:integrase